MVGVREIERFIAKKIIDSSIWTARKYYGALASAFQKAVDWNYIPENPFRRVKKPKPEEQDAPFISPMQFRSIFLQQSCERRGKHPHRSSPCRPQQHHHD
jgi:hypothetical protein